MYTHAYTNTYTYMYMYVYVCVYIYTCMLLWSKYNMNMSKLMSKWEHLWTTHSLSMAQTIGQTRIYICLTIKNKKHLELFHYRGTSMQSNDIEYIYI